MANISWRICFQDALVSSLPYVHSDHHPICLKFQASMDPSGAKHFRFLAAWMLHKGYPLVLPRAWKKDVSHQAYFQNLSVELMDWNKRVCGNIFHEKRVMLKHIHGIQKARDYYRKKFLQKLEKEFGKNLDDILNREDAFWLQKSRKEWIRDGDKNTKYYHPKTIIRRRKKKIMDLHSSEGV